MVERKCQSCGKKFDVTPSRIKRGGGKYCSQECYGKARSGENHPKWKGGPIECTCQVCGKTFTVIPSRIKKGGGKYCSKECQNKGRSGENNPNWSRIERTCQTCGKKFDVVPAVIKNGKGKYCSRECFDKGQRGENNSRWNSIERTCQTCEETFLTKLSNIKYGGGKYCSFECYNQSQIKKIERTCQVCGKGFTSTPSTIKKGGGKYCSYECKDKGQRGENSPTWKGGISFEPYCPKFNNEFKERVRDFWGRRCGICGEKENGRKLSVHHVNYNKMVCCDDTPPLFIPTCEVCHGKTNHRREAWEHNLTEYIMIWFDGESYLPSPSK